MSKTPKSSITMDANPSGVNQYSGAARAAAAKSGKAHAASKSVGGEGKTMVMLNSRAAKANRMAAHAHVAAAKLAGSKEQKSKHTDKAYMHRQMAEFHSAKARG